MSFALRILGVITLFFASASFFFVRREVRDAKIRYREATEEPLVDMVYSLSSFVASSVEREGIIRNDVLAPFKVSRMPLIDATIHNIKKTRIETQVLLLDKSGMLLFDSHDRNTIGTSFAAWRDVALALKGNYGARTTKEEGMSCSTMYLSAPIMVQNVVEGVVTVAKPNCNANELIKTTQERIVAIATILFSGAGIAAILATLLIARPLRRLHAYVRGLRDRKPVTLPPLPRGELRELGVTISEMHSAIDGSTRVDKYTRSLSHELKTPLAAIRGSVQVIRETLDSETREHFLSCIEKETVRMYTLIESLFALNSLSLSTELENGTVFSLRQVVENVIDEFRPISETKSIALELHIDGDFSTKGNVFWVSEAIRNVVKNAFDFAPPESGKVDISLRRGSQDIECTIEDNGPGIPEWALEKVCDQFFSIPKTGQSSRSSGLGLAIAREVMDRIGGAIKVANRTSSDDALVGAKVLLSFPPVSESP
jgi:two-component system, OmpR family, sensor histidine kinase CreC